MANAAWTVVSAIALVIVLILASSTQEADKPIAPTWVGTISGLGCYVVLNVLMVLSRIWSTLPPKR